MIDVAVGQCPDCARPLVYLKWVDDKQKIVVECPDCGISLHFDLTRLIEAIGSPLSPDEDLLMSFVPKKVH